MFNVNNLVLTCHDKVVDEKYFTLNNCDEKNIHNIKFGLFELFRNSESVDLGIYVLDFPIEIKSETEVEFKAINRYHFHERRFTSNYMKMVFTFEDEDQVQYRCFAQKDVSDEAVKEQGYMLGEWSIELESI